MKLIGIYWNSKNSKNISFCDKNVGGALSSEKFNNLVQKSPRPIKKFVIMIKLWKKLLLRRQLSRLSRSKSS